MDDKQTPAQRKRMLIALALSALILIGFDFFGKEYLGYGVMGATSKPAAVEAKADATVSGTLVAGAEAAPGAGLASTTLSAPAPAPVRVALANASVDAQVVTTGGRIDTLVLKKYGETLGATGGYRLFKPEGKNAEYVAGGWMGGGIEAPGETTAWSVISQEEGKVVLAWNNGTGQSFSRTYSLRPGSYVLDVTETATNSAHLPVTMTPYVQVHRADGGLEGEHSTWVNFSGPMGVADGITHEDSYKDLSKNTESEKISGRGGWWGITSQYFMSAIVPGGGLVSERQFRHEKVGERDFYTASVSWPGVVVPAGGSAQVQYQIYAGPKQDGALTAAGNDLERAIDWGWFKVIAKPLYHALVWFHGVLFGSWALAVIALTLALKLATFPLANKSYHSMAKMKKLQPRITALKERYGNDQQAMAQEMMKIYREEKVNPVSGCWPIFIQIPIFFAMYKVVLVAFEFRHAPLGLWMHDMSAADPFFVLPVLMGISMYVQFRLNPAPTDPIQASMFKWMPALMTVMFLWFPSGLVLYWLTNNILSIVQQVIIMRKDKAI